MGALASSQTTTAQFCRGTDKSAIQFPTWSVGIGDGTTATVTKYNVPNGYCYANACFNNLAGVSTETVFSGVAKLGTLVSSPDMGSNPTTATKACGRANSACAVPLLAGLVAKLWSRNAQRVPLLLATLAVTPRTSRSNLVLFPLFSLLRIPCLQMRGLFRASNIGRRCHLRFSS